MRGFLSVLGSLLVIGFLTMGYECWRYLDDFLRGTSLYEWLFPSSSFH